MNKKDKFISAAELLKKVLVGGALVFGLGVAPSCTRSESDSDETNTEQTDAPLDQEQICVTNTDYSAITINEYSDIEQLFDKSLNIIFAEAILEEVPMPNAYDDRGKFKGKKNTIGVGSTYSPIRVPDYKNSNITWYHLAANSKTFSTRKATPEDMLKLLMGWGKYRKNTQNSRTKKIEKHETVLQRMFVQLKGATLRPNEFAALFMAVYNNETNISKLCPIIRDNCRNPLKCANEIMVWYKKCSANPGLKDRCEFEAAVYLNVGNFCECMLDMYTCPSRRASCINTKGVEAITLTRKNYKEWCKAAKQKYLGVVYRDKGKRTGDICKSCSRYFINPLYEIGDELEANLQKQYNEAISLYNAKEYQSALEKFLTIEREGGDGCDLFNDIAVTALNLKKYEMCVSYCQKVLQTTETNEYAKACYNAGLAYESQGNYDKAILNYSQAIKYFEKYGVSGGNTMVIDYKKIYNIALERLKTQKANIKSKGK